MGVIQSGINRTLGMLAGGSVALQKKAGFGLFGKGNELSQRQEQAQQKTKQVQEAKTKQRRNFMTYLAKQPTSLGGTVGDLPVSMQKEIAKGYSSSQRRTMMNRMDKEANNGK